MQHWSADTLFWQLSIDHNMDVQYQVKHKLLVCTKVFYPESQLKISNPKMFSRSQIRLNLAKGFAYRITIISESPTPTPHRAINPARCQHGYRLFTDTFFRYMKLSLFYFQILQQHSSWPRSSRRWIRYIWREGLLAGQKLLGDPMGNARLYHDVQKQR